MEEKTYGDLYEEFLRKVGLDVKEKEEIVADWRPAISPYIDDLFCVGEFVDSNLFCKNGIVVWLKDGTTMIYVGKGE